MHRDYKDYILTNLAAYPGIVEEESVVQKINSMLRALEAAGMDSLVSNFCDNPDARDILFEVWIGYLLLANHNIENLFYEPKGEPRPPDFRFSIHDVHFDVQVKRLHNTENEMTKLLFRRECERHLSRIPKPWFINFWVSDDFERQNLNEFFSYIRENVESFETATDLRVAVAANQYVWKKDNKLLVRFSFMRKNGDAPGIWPGVIEEFGTEGGMFRAVDVAATRKAVERQLKKSKRTLTRTVSQTQSNLVIVQAASNLWMRRNTMSDVLYGSECISTAMAQDGTWMQRQHHTPGGLFDGRRFSSICGVVLVPHTATPIDDQFTGDYFPNPLYLNQIQRHPKPFDSMTFCILQEWVNGSPWKQLIFAD
ncbi:MAG: hypothetical protein HYX78_11515 [Armatimonadetes bacterium]|nr:hypothetical protein [Armatimonadota bacterium]